jgi:hypothetical protein
MLQRVLEFFVSSAALLASLALQVPTPTPIVIQATPAPGLAALPPHPEPQECPADRRIGDEQVDALAARLGRATPTASDEGMPGDEATFLQPAGESVDAETVEAVELVVRQVLACYNANDGLAVLGLLSEDALRRMPPDVLRTIDSLFIQGSGPRDRLERLGYARVYDVVRLEGGRIGAMVEVMRPPANAPGVHLDYAYFREEDGRLALDGVVPDAAPPPPTALESTPSSAP